MQLHEYSYTVPAPLASAVQSSLQEWSDGHKVQRLWSRDASLWTNRDEGRWLGWLSIADEQLADLQPLINLAEEAKRGGFTHAVVLGMGCSSLCPEVLKMTFGITVQNFTFSIRLIRLRSKLSREG